MVGTATVGIDVGGVVSRIVVGAGVGTALCERPVDNVGFNDAKRVGGAVCSGRIENSGLAVRASLSSGFLPTTGGIDDRPDGRSDFLPSMIVTAVAILVGRIDAISVGAGTGASGGA